MTVYVSKGFETNQLKEIESDKDDFETIVSSKVMTFEDVSSLDTIKRHKGYFFIAGELSKSIRSNDTLISKTILALDYDDIKITEKEFKNHLQNKIGVLNYYAYPSISNGLKGTRYRLIIKTDRPFNREENKPLIEFITDQIGLPYDKASDTWSQLQGLKTTFESKSEYEGKCIYNEGKGLYKCDNALKQMKEREVKKKIKKQAFTVNYSRNRTFTAEFLQRLIQPIENGERNVKLTSLVGKLFSLGVDPNSAYEWIHLINDNFVTPALEEDEVNKIFKSILKAEQTKMMKGG